jgi:ABC-type microcin C transport system permease subunit YejB
MDEDTTSENYRKATQLCLAIIITVGYWLAGIGFLSSIPLVKKDLREEFVLGKLSGRRIIGFNIFAGVLAIVVITLFVVSLVYQA